MIHCTACTQWLQCIAGQVTSAHCHEPGAEHMTRIVIGTQELISWRYPISAFTSWPVSLTPQVLNCPKVHFNNKLAWLILKSKPAGILQGQTERLFFFHSSEPNFFYFVSFREYLLVALKKKKKWTCRTSGELDISPCGTLLQQSCGYGKQKGFCLLWGLSSVFSSRQTFGVCCILLLRQSRGCW